MKFFKCKEREVKEIKNEGVKCMDEVKERENERVNKTFKNN